MITLNRMVPLVMTWFINHLSIARYSYIYHEWQLPLLITTGRCVDVASRHIGAPRDSGTWHFSTCPKLPCPGTALGPSRCQGKPWLKLLICQVGWLVGWFRFISGFSSLVQVWFRFGWGLVEVGWFRWVADFLVIDSLVSMNHHRCSSKLRLAK